MSVLVRMTFTGTSVPVDEKHEIAEILPTGLYTKDGNTETWVPWSRFDQVSIIRLDEKDIPVVVKVPQTTSAEVLVSRKE